MRSNTPVANMKSKMHGTPFFTYLTPFTTWMERLGYAKSTMISYSQQLCTFFHWLTTNQINTLSAVNQSILERYNHYLHTKTSLLSGGGLSTSSIQNHLTTIRLFDQYLQCIQNQKILHGPLIVTKTAPTPRSILTQEEIKLLYNATDQSILGYRDRAILSLYYGCGLRNREGQRIELTHLHYQQHLLQVLPGKTYQGRYVPMSPSVKATLQAYQDYSRPYLTNQKECKMLIISTQGTPMRGNSMRERIKKLVSQAQIGKTIGLHSLRHSIATHLLQSGMPLEQISRFLGHKQLDTTQIYTRLVEELDHG
jgi:site-specific recombinase XerD